VKTNWPDKLPEYIIENPVVDLLHEEIDYSQNILGDLWLERNTYAIIQGTSGIGKSMVAVQIGVEAALGRLVFGLRVERPLRVLIVQAEDSKNDRILQTTCIHKLAVTKEERLTVSQNLRIVTPRKRTHRGKALFDFLADAFRDCEFDLFILNPAFAFLDGDVNGTESVGDFLRTQLQEFLRAKNAAAIVVHHVPRPPKSGKARAADTTMYSAHGSAEWTNAPRASITIERTKVPHVFEFKISKRGGRRSLPSPFCRRSTGSERKIWRSM
jgi:RecA-family ATPase